MIPKKIHYCWFGHNPLPELAIKCINSWKKFFPDYEIIEWNESNFNVNIIPYTAEAYRLKKYAFVSDYARFWILYNYGGLYFDTDVEVIKGMEDIIDKGAFMGCELAPINNGPLVPIIAPGLGMGAQANHPLYKQVIDYYQNNHFMSLKGRMTGTVVQIVSSILLKNELNVNLFEITKIKDIYIYPNDFFCPMVALTKEIHITDNTRSIHHYTATWKNPNRNRLKNIRQRLYNIFIRIIIQMKFNLFH